MKDSGKAVASTEITRRNERKWGREVIAAGWLAVPSVLLQRQRAFGLDPLDLNIILQIADHWWEPENHPYPSKKTIAQRIDVDPRTIQRRITRLAKDGLLDRVERRDGRGGNKTNIYRLTRLAEKAKPFALELLEEREARKRGKAERQRRKRPLLQLLRSKKS
jgi:DNA-binding transcriptional ArsR family regulator